MYFPRSLENHERGDESGIEDRKLGKRKIEEYNKNHPTNRCLRLSKAPLKKIEERKLEKSREKREKALGCADCAL